MPDDAQAQAVHDFERVWQELIQRYKASKRRSAVSAAKQHHRVFICGVV